MQIHVFCQVIRQKSAVLRFCRRSFPGFHFGMYKNFNNPGARIPSAYSGQFIRAVNHFLGLNQRKAFSLAGVENSVEIVQNSAFFITYKIKQ